MCYVCQFLGNADNVLEHSLSCHQPNSKFSLRQQIFDEQLGQIAYKSLHFPWTISKLKEHRENGVNLKIDTERRKISFKRKYTDVKNQSCASSTTSDKSTQTSNKADDEISKLHKKVKQILKEKGRYEDYISVLKCIADNTLTDNIALHLLLDVGNFYSKKSISCLRYSEETLAFWVTVKKLFKGKGINFFRGFKAQGIEKLEEEQIKPRDCRINFAVPSNPILSKESAKYTIGAGSPGILTASLDAFADNNTGKDVKISIDGKKIAFGLGNSGDENLGGFENSPTLQQRKDRVDTETNNLTVASSYVENNVNKGAVSVNDVRDNNTLKKGLLLAISHLSARVQELRELTVRRKRHIENLMKAVEGDWKQSKLAHAISYWQTKLISARNCTSDLLESIDKLGYAVACLNGTSENYITGSKSTVFLDKQSNYICLKEAADSQSSMDSTTVKQRSEHWHELRNGSRVTGSTLFRALGLSTLKEQKEHHDKVYKGIETPIPEHLSPLLEYGTSQEINALGSLVGKIIPVYFPDLKYQEDGCVIIPFGDTRAVVSGDGTGVNKCNEDKVAFEFKCPMPGKKHKTDVQYELPVYYTTQMLSQMAAKKLQEAVFISFTPDSVTYIRAKFDHDLWTRIWKLTMKYYGSSDSVRPSRRDPDIPTILNDLKSYAKKCEFIAEFPSLRSVSCSCAFADDPSTMFGHHTTDSTIERTETMTWEELSVVLQKSSDTLYTAYNIVRRPAKEVLVTVISDIERQASGNDTIAHAVPIHHGLSGFSLPMDAVRQILNQVIAAVHERQLNIKAVTFDGQFLEIAVVDDSKKALTVLRFLKQFWEEVKSIDKKVKRTP